MKNRSIAFQAWIIMSAFAIFISVIAVLTISLTINNYFKRSTLSVLRTSQMEEMEKGHLSSLDSRLERALIIDDSDIPKHILISREDVLFINKYSGIAETVALDIGAQNSSYGEYSRNYNNLKLFYVVKAFIYNSKPYYLVTIFWDKRQNKIIFDLIRSIVRVLSTVLIINIILAKLISRYLMAPVRYLEKKVSEIARKEWDTEIELDRKDELGRLAVSINMMKDSLKKKDLEEQTFIQTISHDLKTPVMIIQSYAQALMDRLYINNSFEDTVKVIETEAERLESKIEKLLYLYSFDYIMNNRKDYEEVDLEEMIRNIAKKISLLRKEIDIYIDMPRISVYGSRTDLQQAFENILDNNLRYTKSFIRISGRKTSYEREGVIERKAEIDFFNDGEPIDNTVIKNLFSKYQKGKNGRFGLGLFIAKKIIEFHKGEIRAENLNNGVIFRVTLPLRQ